MEAKYPIRNARPLLLLCTLALGAAAAACGDTDSMTNDLTSGSGGAAGESGSGGTGGTGGVGGSSGSGGVGGTSGSGGTGGGSVDACPDSAANCADEIVTAVCKSIVDCNRIPGPPLTQERCEAEVSQDCVDCAVSTSSEDGGTLDPNAPVDCDTPADPSCDSACSFLIDPPTTNEECIEIQESGTNSEAYGVCLCDNCMDEFGACLDDHGCWEIVQCAIAVDCSGMACYAPNTCMAIIDEVGATSISTALSTELGNCTSQCLSLR